MTLLQAASQLPEMRSITLHPKYQLWGETVPSGTPEPNLETIILEDRDFKAFQDARIHPNKFDCVVLLKQLGENRAIKLVETLIVTGTVIDIAQ